MSDLTFIVERATKDRNYGVHLWTPGQDLGAEIWTSSGGSSDEGGTRAKSKLLASDGSLYLGLNTGYVGLQTARILRLNSETGDVLGTFEGRVGFEINDGRSEYNAVQGFVENEGTVYDYGIGGLYETLTGDRIDPRLIESAEVVDGVLCIVPHGDDISLPREERTIYARGDLIDVDTGRTLMEKIHPFDGSGFRPGTHFIHDGRVYIAHGNSATEITIRFLADGSVIQSKCTGDGGRFFAHDGVVYDVRSIRYVHVDDENIFFVSGIVRADSPAGSTTKTTEGVIKDLDTTRTTSVTSVASGDDLGILVALYDTKRDRTVVASHKHLETPILESDGYLRIERV